MTAMAWQAPELCAGEVEGSLATPGVSGLWLVQGCCRSVRERKNIDRRWRRYRFAFGLCAGRSWSAGLSAGARSAGARVFLGRRRYRFAAVSLALWSGRYGTGPLGAGLLPAPWRAARRVFLGWRRSRFAAVSLALWSGRYGTGPLVAGLLPAPWRAAAGADRG